MSRERHGVTRRKADGGGRCASSNESSLELVVVVGILAACSAAFAATVPNECERIIGAALHLDGILAIVAAFGEIGSARLEPVTRSRRHHWLSIRAA
jgi:hypothetical protein